MKKVAAAVIRFEDKVLLMRRSPDQKFPGFWEFPGGKVEQGERITAALKRELDEELYIKAKIGKMITSVPFGKYEIFAYDVKYYDGTIRLSVHDDMEWVTLDEALKYNLLPADRKIVMHMTNTKEKNSAPSYTSFAEHITRHISKPVFDQQEQTWIVAIESKTQKSKKYKFTNEYLAMDFYINEARKVLTPFFESPQNTH
jgi:8-oxo-dGTP diphosphatase